MKATIKIWKTLTDTFSLVSQYRRDGLYPILSFMMMLLLTYALMIPLLVRVLMTRFDTVPNPTLDAC